VNEQIKEFEKQCWDHQTNHLNARKFAELIVKECADIADFCDQVESVEAVSSVLKRHFGVENENDERTN
jgi:hypothetical protein